MQSLSKKTIVFLLIAQVLLFTLILPLGFAKAVPLFYGFGGAVLTAIPCTTPPAWLIYIKPANKLSPSNFMILPPPATRWYAYFLPFVPTTAVLGTYDLTPITCIIGFIPVGFGFHVFQVGSGLPGSGL